MKKIKRNIDEFQFQIASNIAMHGRQIIGVIPEPRKTGFSYTIGNHIKGLPELLIIGNFNPHMMGQALNKLSEMLIERGKPFDNGSSVSLGGAMSLMAWDTQPEAKTRFTIQASEYFGTDEYTVQQLVLPDPDGHFPDDPKCNKDYKVPILKQVKILH